MAVCPKRHYRHRRCQMQPWAPLIACQSFDPACPLDAFVDRIRTLSAPWQLLDIAPGQSTQQLMLLLAAGTSSAGFSLKNPAG